MNSSQKNSLYCSNYKDFYISYVNKNQYVYICQDVCMCVHGWMGRWMEGQVKHMIFQFGIILCAAVITSEQ